MMDKGDPCLTVEEITKFLEGDLDPDRMIRFDRHLSRCDTCMSVLKQSDQDVFPTQPDLSETWPAARPELSADGINDSSERRPHFSELILRKRIGRGGFGDVYLAEQRNTNNRLVAVKILHRKVSSIESNRSFRQEVSALIRIKHDNIARIYQKCVAEDGRIGIVMEYVEGQPLADGVADETIGVKDRLRIADSLCRAVQHIHDQGIIHRDLTTRNILLVKADGQLVPKVIDFGLSIFSNRLQLRLMRGAGTTSFMAPEQTGHDKAEVSEKSDIYALGLCIFELLSGQRASRREQGESTKAFHDRKFAATFQLPRLGTFLHLGKALGRSKLREFDAILAKATSTDPAGRYPSVDAFRSDLLAVQNHQPTSLRSHHRLHRSRLFLFRNRRFVLTSAALSMLAVVSRALVLSYERADQLVSELGDFTGGVIDRVNPMVAPSPTDATDEQSKQLAEFIGDASLDLEDRDSDAFLVVRLKAANTLQALGSFEAAIPKLETLVEDCASRFGRDDDDTLAIEMHLARAYLGAGQFLNARNAYMRAFEVWRERYGEHDNRSLTVMHYVAELERKAGNYDASVVMSQSVIDKYRPNPDEPDLMLAGVRITKGQSLFSLKRYRQAISEFQQAEKQFLSAGLRSDNPTVLRINSDIALAESWLGECESAKSRISVVIGETRRVFPLGALEIDTITINMAVIYSLCGQHDRAADLLRDVLASTRHAEPKTRAAKELEAIERRSIDGMEPNP